MTRSIVWACIVCSGLSFLLFLASIGRQILATPAEGKKPADAFIIPGDLQNLLTAGQAFVDALAKAGPHILALVASIIFMWLAIHANGQGDKPANPPTTPDPTQTR